MKNAYRIKLRQRRKNTQILFFSFVQQAIKPTPRYANIMHIYNSILISGVVSLREDEHNQENDPCFQIVPTNETAHVNISLLNNSNQEQTCS